MDVATNHVTIASQHGKAKSPRSPLGTGLQLQTRPYRQLLHHPTCTRVPGAELRSSWVLAVHLFVCEFVCLFVCVFDFGAFIC